MSTDISSLTDIDTNKLTEFWDWFKSISIQLATNITDKKLISLIDDRVNKLGPFDWEIGPWKEGNYFFTISPNLDIDKLPFTKRIIDLAPPCPGWHFLPSKPPKEWNGIWKMKNETGKNIIIDTSTWEYILYKFDDGTFDIDLKTDEIEGDQETKTLAADIALTAYLGEENFMLMLKNIQIVKQFEENINNKASLLRHIKKHIEKN